MSKHSLRAFFSDIASSYFCLCQSAFQKQVHIKVEENEKVCDMSHTVLIFLNQMEKCDKCNFGHKDLLCVCSVRSTCYQGMKLFLSVTNVSS